MLKVRYYIHRQQPQYNTLQKIPLGLLHFQQWTVDQVSYKHMLKCSSNYMPPVQDGSPESFLYTNIIHRQPSLLYHSSRQMCHWYDELLWVYTRFAVTPGPTLRCLCGTLEPWTTTEQHLLWEQWLAELNQCLQKFPLKLSSVPMWLLQRWSMFQTSEKRENVFNDKNQREALKSR